MLGNLIGAFIIILVGVSLAPTVANEVVNAKGWNGSTYAGNVSTAGQAMYGLVTIFFALGVASAGIGAAVMGLRKGGLM